MRAAKVILATAFVFGSIAAASAQGGGGGAGGGGGNSPQRRAAKALPVVQDPLIPLRP